ncbi:MAG: hypothetical protein WCW16_04350 [Candidatus Magasanikbacteria bacterium]
MSHIGKEEKVEELKKKGVVEDADEEKETVVLHEKKQNVSQESTEGLKELIEKNIKWSQVIYNQNKKIKHRLTLLVLGNYFRLLLILVPLILAIVYLPPYIEDLWKQYEPLINTYINSQDTMSSLLNTVNNSGLDRQQLQNILNQMGQQ